MKILIVYKEHEYDEIIGICEDKGSAKDLIKKFHYSSDVCDEELKESHDGDGFVCYVHRYFTKVGETNKPIRNY